VTENYVYILRGLFRYVSSFFFFFFFFEFFFFFMVLHSLFSNQAKELQANFLHMSLLSK
jgi:hypothetical protein